MHGLHSGRAFDSEARRAASYLFIADLCHALFRFSVCTFTVIRNTQVSMRCAIVDRVEDMMTFLSLIFPGDGLDETADFLFLYSNWHAILGIS
jgi:hypothetical protein